MIQYDRTFFSEVGGERFSRVNSLSYNIGYSTDLQRGCNRVTRISVKELLSTLGDRGYETMIL